MLYLARDRKTDSSFARGVLLFCLAVFVCMAAGLRVNAQTIATYSFEDGTTQGWTSFNGATVPVNTTAAAYDGSHSLLTTTTSTGQGGP